jgi:hypothetical protein
MWWANSGFKFNYIITDSDNVFSRFEKFPKMTNIFVERNFH